MGIHSNSFKKINKPLEPRFELTQVRNFAEETYELYHEPSGSIEIFSRKEILKVGFTPAQLKMVKKETTYFQIKRRSH